MARARRTGYPRWTAQLLIVVLLWTMLIPLSAVRASAPTTTRLLSRARLAVVEYDPEEALAFPISPEEVAAWADNTIRLLQEMGYRHPDPPASIRLVGMGGALHGRFTAIDGIWLDPYSPDPLKTLDHELFHWVQQAYPRALSAGLWWLEGTAEWWALFRPDVDRAPALAYGRRLNAGLTSPLVSPYPAALFMKRLAHRHGADLIRQAMERGAAGPDYMVRTLAALVGEAVFRDELFAFLMQAWLRDTDALTSGNSPSLDQSVAIVRGAGRVEPLSADVLLVRFDPANAPARVTLELSLTPLAEPGSVRLWLARFAPGPMVDVVVLPQGSVIEVEPAGASAVAVGVASLIPGHRPVAVRLASVSWYGGRLETPGTPALTRAESRATYLATWSDRLPPKPGTPPRKTDPALWMACPTTPPRISRTAGQY